MHLLLQKKKYCGMKFESRDQKKPVFEAKGIETVRRDQCSLTQKILRNSLITLFTSGLSAVKSYVFRQWALILSGKLPASDFILTGRVRSRYRGGREGPVQAALHNRLKSADNHRVIKHKERLAYVIVAAPGANVRLRDCVVTPMEVLELSDSLTINSTYYITRHVNAALQRCLSLPPHRVDVGSWYNSCPKPRLQIRFWPNSGTRNKIITAFFGSDVCSLCGNKAKAKGGFKASICSQCRQDPLFATETASIRLSRAQREALALAKHCSGCNLCFEDATTFGEVHVAEKRRLVPNTSHLNASLVPPLANCTCIDCPLTFERHRARSAEIQALEICNALNFS